MEWHVPIADNNPRPLEQERNVTACIREHKHDTRSVTVGNLTADGGDDEAVTAPDAIIISLAEPAGRSNTSVALASAARYQCGQQGWQ